MKYTSAYITTIKTEAEVFTNNIEHLMMTKPITGRTV
jgi:hypothetical protein